MSSSSLLDGIASCGDPSRRPRSRPTSCLRLAPALHWGQHRATAPDRRIFGHRDNPTPGGFGNAPIPLDPLLVFLLLTAFGPSSQAQEKPNDATMGAKPPEGAVVLFDGTTLEGWVKSDGKSPADWPVADGILTVGKGDIMTEKAFGNIQLHLEFNVPYMPKASGQGRGNSGVYLAASTSSRSSTPTA